MWGKGGSGIKEWQPSCAYFHGFLNKSRDVVGKVAMGHVIISSLSFQLWSYPDNFSEKQTR